MKQLREHQPAEDHEVQDNQHGGQALVIAGQTPVGVFRAEVAAPPQTRRRA